MNDPRSLGLSGSNRPESWFRMFGRPPKSSRTLFIAFTTAFLIGQPLAQELSGAAARQLVAYLEVFSTADRASLTQFRLDHWPSAPEAEIERTLSLYGQTGGFDLLEIEEVTETRATAIVREASSDRIARISLDVEPEAPFHIQGMTASLIPTPPEYSVPRLSETDLLTQLSEELELRSQSGRFSGTVLIAKDGNEIFAGAYGFADRENETPNALPTRFRHGSMSKMFTATAIMTLVEAGEVSLDAAIGQYLEGYPNQELASTVTIHHLLTHTGGTGDIFGPEFDENRLALRTHQDYLRLFGGRNPQFPPGERFEYSNYGYVLLGAIIEVVSGQEYYEYVDEHVFLPAGMTSTGSLPEDVQISGLSVGYTRSREGLVPNSESLPYRGTAAGGGYTTVGDLLRFANALEKNILLAPENAVRLTTGEVNSGSGRYAYGFGESISDGRRSIGHGGGAPGMNSELIISTPGM